MTPAKPYPANPLLTPSSLPLQGDVEIRDGDHGLDKITIDIEKTAPDKDALAHFVVNRTLVDVGDAHFYVLQVVSAQLVLS